MTKNERLQTIKYLQLLMNLKTQAKLVGDKSMIKILTKKFDEVVIILGTK